MTIRTKTIEYAFDANRSASLAAATRFEFPTMSIYIPETGSRTFRSAFIELNFRDNVTAATSLTSTLIGIKLGTSSYSDETISNLSPGKTNTGEQQSFCMLRDVTSYFNSNFNSFATQSCQVAVQFGTLTTNNHAAKLYLTYDYDDTADIRIKTVRIPIGSAPSSISNTLQELSTGSVPALDTFLPEVGKAYRDIWFEIQGNDGSGTVDTYLVTALDAETAVSSAIHEHGLGSALWHKTFWKRTNMDTSTTHSFNIGVAAASAQTRFGNVAVLLGTTYEYTHSLSSQSMNSLVIPIVDDSGAIGDYIARSGTAPFYVAESSQTEKEFFISEPAPIIAKQSGLLLFYNDTGTGGDIRISINNGIGSTRYRRLHGTLACGQYAVMHRFDQAGVQIQNAVSGLRTFPNLFTLRRGRNTIKTTFDRTLNASAIAANASAIAYINYVSNIHPNGDAVHNQTRIYAISGHRQVNILNQFQSTFAPTASLGSYYKNNAVGFGVIWQTGAEDSGIALTVRPTDAEISGGIDNGWIGLYESMIDISFESGICTSYAQGISRFQRYPNDPDITRINLTTPHIYSVQTPSSRLAAGSNSTNYIYYGGSTLLWTYHNIYTPVTRSITGYPSGNGSGIQVSILKSGSDEIVYETTTTAGGEYSFVAYDANVSLYATAYDSASGFAGSSRYFTPSV